MLLFNMIGSEDNDEFDLMYLWLEEINPLVYVLNINGIYEGLETFGGDTHKIENKVTQYLCFLQQNKYIHYDYQRTQRTTTFAKKAKINYCEQRIFAATT